ncbi:MAG: hypothetical protein JO324_05060 [Candidatus Eremiobacteraeota bacterium]|nr:hypothetical protein [Candidatus Eremiobacteraeota bacterium]
MNTGLLLRHYAVVGPLLERLFGPIPLVWSTTPKGPDGPTIFHGPLSEKTQPKGPVVDVPTAQGVHRYPALSAARIQGLVEHGAVEFYSWSPTAANPTRARCGRLLLETLRAGDNDELERALGMLEEMLELAGVATLRVYDGGFGAALWMPFGDEPSYADVRNFLHGICAKAVEQFPDVMTQAPNSHGGAPVHLHVQTNAVGRFSVLPYSVRAGTEYSVALPVDLGSLRGNFRNGDVRVKDLEGWLKRYGEVFSEQRADFWSQPLPTVAGRAPRALQKMPAQKSHGPIVSAAIAVLQDGHAHSAEEILAIALKRGALDASVTHKYVYTSLIEYIARANGNGRRPAIVQNADRSFRINEPPDEWPDLPEAPAPALAPEVAALIARLERTASGGAAAQFEQAVCDAFAALGFEATHDGAQKAPDGYADALLGPLGYRVMIECKSADEGVNDPSVFEAAKFREPFNAQFCALVARAFSGEIELVKELQNHGVSAWTVADLQTLLRIGANPLEMRPLFAPGFAADGLDDLLWERIHGKRKRVRLIADAIVRAGSMVQARYYGDPARAPALTEDVAMLLVDDDLRMHGSSAQCDRDEVREALTYLANPLVGAITMSGDGMVVLKPGHASTSSA